MNLKKLISMVLVVALCCAASVGLTVAYLTDRDSKANIFTSGDVNIDLTEDFQQGATLIPGVKIEKAPKITNLGPNDAWVWMTIAIPAALDNLALGQEGSSKNVIHWNCLGATWEGYVTQKYVDSAIEKGYLPAGTTAESILNANTTWDVNNDVAPFQQEIDGVLYNVYTLLYNKALTPQETTLPSMFQVYLDANVDIAPNGDWAHIEGGVVTPLDWNSTEDGNPIIYVSAYAIQKDTFSTVNEGYDAYQKQWGSNGTEYGNQANVVYTADQLRRALAEGGEIILGRDIYFTDEDSTIGGFAVPTFLDVSTDASLRFNGYRIIVERSDTQALALFTIRNGVNFKVDGNNGGVLITSSDCAIFLTYNTGTVDILGGNYITNSYSTGSPNDVFACVYSNGGLVNVYGGTFTFQNLSSGTNGGFNVGDGVGNKLTIVLHEGVLLSTPDFRQPDKGSNPESLRIQLAEGCTIEETIINGTTWYKVVKN